MKTKTRSSQSTQPKTIKRPEVTEQTSELSEEESGRRLSAIRVPSGSQSKDFGGRTHQRSPPSTQASGLMTPPQTSSSKIRDQAPSTASQSAKRSRNATSADESSGEEQQSRRRKKAASDKQDFLSIMQQMAAHSAALEEVSRYIWSPESKLNKVQSALIQRNLDAAERAAQEMSVKNSYLAGRCSVLTEGLGDGASILAGELKEMMPSTSPIVRAISQVQKGVQELQGQPSERRECPTKEDLITAVTELGGKVDKRHQELISLHKASYARIATSGKENTSEIDVTDIGDNEEVEWAQDRRRKLKKRATRNKQPNLDKNKQQNTYYKKAEENTDKDTQNTHIPKNLTSTTNRGEIKQPDDELELKKSKENDARLILVEVQEGVTSGDMLKKIKSKINPRENSIKIQDIRITAKGGIAIKAESLNDREKILTLPAFANGGFITRSAPQRLPRILVLRVSAELSREEVREQIKSCNNMGEEGTQISPLYTMPYGRKKGEKGQNEPPPAFVSWVVELSPKLWKATIDAGRLFLEFQSCKAKEFLEVTRCFNCQGYGHTAKACSVQSPTCGQCSGAHDTRKCTSTTNQCTNCEKIGAPSRHRAASLGCEAHRRAFIKLKASIDYGSEAQDRTA